MCYVFIGEKVIMTSQIHSCVLNKRAKPTFHNPFCQWVRVEAILFLKANSDFKYPNVFIAWKLPSLWYRLKNILINYVIN